MAEYDFSVIYDGPAVAAGRMDVQELAPALIGLANAFREANALLYPDSAPVSLEISATERGSFAVVLLLAKPDILARAVKLLSSDGADALSNLYTYIFGAGVGLMWLLRRLHGRRVVRQETIEPGTIRLHLDDTSYLDVPDSTLALFRSLAVRKSVKEIVTPLQTERVEEVRITAGPDTEPMVITEADVPAYDLPESTRDALADYTGVEALTLASVAFTEGNKWRVSDGNATFYATMADQDFLARIEDGEAFRKNDILRCQVRREQWQDDNGLHTDCTILQVIDHIPAARPLQLPFDQEPE